MPRLVPVVALALAWVALASSAARAGHEIPFYPSFYPQEITISPATPEVAAGLLEKKAIHAYVGPDPYRGAPPPPHVEMVDSLRSYVVLTFNRAAPGLADPAARCAAASRALRSLSKAKGDWVFHPYPVTPYHADYVAHVDLAQAARKRLRAGEGDATPLPRARATGRAAEIARAAGWRPASDAWDATLEEISLRDLLAAREARIDGWSWPPWLKAGWFHAYLLSAPEIGDGPSSRAVEEALARRTGGGQDAAARRNAERKVVGLATAGCERVVAGYTVARQAVNRDYSDGVENVAYDSQTGLDSAVFLRTVKLKDFPWNGWLHLAADGRGAAAWNPVGGFTDDIGRLIWAAVGDPALFPDPQGEGWVANRVRLAAGAEPGPAPVDVPPDAVLPDPRTGALRPVGAGVTARAKLVYRVGASAFHDGTKMTPADLLYPFVFALSHGRRAPGGRPDPAVDRAAAVLRESIAAVKVARVETDIKDFGDLQLVFDVPVVEVYLKHAAAASEVAAVAPPWSAIPWQLGVLMEETVGRGLAAYSEQEARRRGVPWLDLARDRKVRDAMAALAEGFERRSWVPEPLRGLVTVEQARQRWAALRRFHARHGHFLVTNGPYQLSRWTPDAVVLSVFRDLSYPLGVGTYDRFAVPVRAFVTAVERRGERLAIQAEVERVERAARSYRVVREPFRPEPGGGRREGVPVAHYTVIGSGGEVAAAGASRELDGARVVVDLRGRLKPGDYQVALALALGGNLVNPEVKVIPYRVTD